MTKEQILRRALEMACKDIGHECQECPVYTKCKTHGIEESSCGSAKFNHFIRKATAESKGKGRK